MMLVLAFLALMLPYESLKITKSGSNHLYHFANKRGSFWVNETAKESRHFLMGFISQREVIFSDYSIRAGNLDLSRGKAVAELEPHLFRRRFAAATEEVFMPDTLEAMFFSWTLSGAPNIEVDFFTQGVISKQPEDSGVPSVLLFETDRKWNKWVAVASETGFLASEIKSGDIKLRIKTSSISGPLAKANVAVGGGQTKKDAIRNAILTLGNAPSLKLAKANRLRTLVENSGFDSSDPILAKALAWALVSFDALNADERKSGLGLGIYAGYPWFQDYWGRDSFIALRALTVSGQADLARANLESFLKFQILSDTSASWGKVPNRVRPDESIYNTADATPRFIIEAWRYVLWTGDLAFVERIKPNLLAAIRGSLKYRTDKTGLLIHNDADSWMDAVGPKGPYSPRGNRANDIQALWLDALLSAKNMFRQIPPSSENTAFITEIDAAYAKAKQSFDALFLNKSGKGAVVLDAVSATDVADPAIRPNQLFTAPFLSVIDRSAMLSQVTRTLGSRYGVFSLDPAHPKFHPFHKYEPVYEQDASYHNGIIWLWNTGEWLSQLISAGETNLAGQVTLAYADAIMNNVALGTLPELADAFPRKAGVSDRFPDENEFRNISRLDQLSIRNEAAVDAQNTPPFSGTFSQAWSLSEFLRNGIEDYAGLRPLESGMLAITPSIPIAWKSYRASSIYRGWKVSVAIEAAGQNRFCTVELEPMRKSTQLQVFIQLPGMKESVNVSMNRSPVKIEVGFNGKVVSYALNGVSAKAPLSPRTVLVPWEFKEALQFYDYSTFDHNRITFTSQTKN